MPFHPLISDQRDLTSTLSEELTQSDIARPDDLSYFGVSDLLTLPQNFGYVDEKLVRELTQELFKTQYYVNLSYDVASGSEITSCNKIDKPLVV